MRSRVICAALACALVATPSLAQETRSVAAVNAPLAYFARALGGDTVDVVYPVEPGIDPAFWEPTDDEILQFQQADLILLNGAGYAGWTKETLLPRSRTVDTTAGVQDRLISAESSGVTHQHGPEGEHSHTGAYAFTTWLDPTLATAQMDAVAEAIVRRWPDLEASVQQRQTALQSELADYDSAMRSYFETLEERQVFGSHPVYQYLDRAYLGHLDALHWEPDADPGEEEWARFGEMLETDRAPIMLWEGTPLPETADRLASLGVEVVVLSPMGNAPDEENLFRSLAAQVE